MNTSKICRTCQLVKTLNEFYKGRIYYQSSCKPCELIRARKWGVNNRQKRNKHLSDWRARNRNTPKLKSRVILENMVKRSKQKGLPKPEFTSDEVLKIIDGGKCSVTGIPFEFSQAEFTKSPWTPSPDRIDTRLGYTKENTQWVCYIYNIMKSEFSNEVVDKFIKVLTHQNEQRETNTRS